MVIFYVDDSGDERLTTFSAIGIPVERWNAASAQWLAWRRWLRDEHGVDVDYRLHATHWVAGRGRPAMESPSLLNRNKPARWSAYVSALDALAAMPELVVLTVARPGIDRSAAYRVLMRGLDALLAERGDYGMVILDGEGPELRALHGELDPLSRRLIEEPWKRDAHESQWLQATDFVAFAAYQHVARRPERAFMWDWYTRCLGDRIVGKGD